MWFVFMTCFFTSLFFICSFVLFDFSYLLFFFSSSLSISHRVRIPLLLSCFSNDTSSLTCLFVSGCLVSLFNSVQSFIFLFNSLAISSPSFQYVLNSHVYFIILSSSLHLLLFPSSLTHFYFIFPFLLSNIDCCFNFNFVMF
jgi:hypothetical protein